jgi:hypothetical protein
LSVSPLPFFPWLLTLVPSTLKASVTITGSKPSEQEQWLYFTVRRMSLRSLVLVLFQAYQYLGICKHLYF